MTDRMARADRAYVAFGIEKAQQLANEGESK